MSSPASKSKSIFSLRSSPKQALVSIAVPSLKLFKDHLKDAADALEFLHVMYEVSIVAAHWAPRKTLRFIDSLEENGIEVIIAGADGSAHLPGMIASLTVIPVIGVPLRGGSLDGLDSLLSTVQMPHGVPVGTMAIDSAHNAGIFAGQILSLKYPQIKVKMHDYKKMLEEKVESEDKQLIQVMNKSITND